MGTFSDNAKRIFDINFCFSDFRNDDDFFDVTLATDSSDGSIEAFGAHKLILSASSPVLRSLLKEQSRLNASSKMMPVMLYLRGITPKGLRHVLDFVYKGSISLPQEELNDFLAVGESLEIPLLERANPSPSKRSPASGNGKKRKRAKMIQPRVLPKDDGKEQIQPESEQSSDTEISLSDFKVDPETAMPNEDVYDGDTNPGLDQDLYEGEVDIKGEQERGTDQALEDPVAEPSDEDQLKLRKAYPCHHPGCDKVYVRKAKLKAHTLKHTGERPYECSWEECGQRFTRQDVLMVHMRYVHCSSDAEFYCPSCDRRLKNKSVMNAHIRRIHGDWDGVDCERFAVKS